MRMRYLFFLFFFLLLLFFTVLHFRFSRSRSVVQLQHSTVSVTAPLACTLYGESRTVGPARSRESGPHGPRSWRRLAPAGQAPAGAGLHHPALRSGQAGSSGIAGKEDFVYRTVVSPTFTLRANGRVAYSVKLISNLEINKH